MPEPTPGDPVDAVLIPRARRAGDDASGWAVLDAEIAGSVGSGLRVALVGPVAHLALDEKAQVTGTWRKHPQFGLQIRADQALPVVPTDREDVVKLLRGLPHVGAKRAEVLVTRYGPRELFDRIDEDPYKAFARLPGMSAARAREASKAWRERSGSRELVMLLAPEKLTFLVGRLEKEFGARAVARVRSDPYSLVSVAGVGFASADRIAQRLGLPADHPRRSHAALLHVLSEAEAQGSSALPLGELARRLERLGLELSEAVLGALEDAGEVEVVDEFVSRAAAAADEQTIADHVRTLLEASGPADGVQVPQTPPLADELSPSEQQWEAVRSAFASRLSLITGGPGTGKTTILKLLVAAAEEQDLSVRLISPTGRAAVRMTEATGHDASTVHAALGWIPGQGPAFGASNPLKADLLVCDESSMANNALFAALFEAVGADTHVVLVGDADQLAPVGAGAPFRELIASGLVPTVRLEHVFRQRARSMIVQAAHAIRRGERPVLRASEGMERDLFVVERSDLGAAADEVCSLVSSRLPAHFGADPLRDILVMTPMHRGELGTVELNRRLRDVLNPTGSPVEGTALRVHDKVMMTGRNLPDLGLMNGTVAFVIGAGHEPGFVLLDVDGTMVEVGDEDAARLQLAYCCTVHKAQGQDVPIAVLICDRSASFMLRRELVYTAITRARTATVVVGQAGELAAAGGRPDTSRRWTRLTARLLVD